MKQTTKRKDRQPLNERLGILILGIFGRGIVDRVKKASIRKDPVLMLGNITIGAFILAVIWTCFFLINTGYSYFGLLFSIIGFPFIVAISFAVLTVAAFIVFRITIEVIIYRRIQAIERHMPEFLRELAINLRAGREFVDAFEDSSSEDLGALHEDISRMVISIRAGETIGKVLNEFVEKYDSYIIQETFSVIYDAYSGGGGLSDIIERIADHLDVIDHLKKKAIASVSNYTIFMTIVALFISPLLFALAFNLINLIKTLLDRVISAGSTQYLPGFIISLNINFHDFITFSMLGVGIIAGSAAAIMGIIRSGNLRGSSVLFLIYVTVSIIVYRLALLMLTAFFSALFAI